MIHTLLSPYVNGCMGTYQRPIFLVGRHFYERTHVPRMTPVPDSGWLQALNLPLRVTIGVALACSTLLVLDSRSVLLLGTFGSLTRPLVIVALVVAAALSITGIGAIVVKHIQRKLERAAVLERLEHLAPFELRLLADAIKEKRQSFYTYVHSPHVATLMAKGIVHSPGGTHNQDHYPFTINDFVWKYLLERKDDFIYRDETNKKSEAEVRRRLR